MWGIAARWRGLYFSLLFLLLTASFAFVIWYESAHQVGDSLGDTVSAIIRGMGFAAAASAALSYYATEVGRYTMVLAGMFEDYVNRRRQESIDRAVAVAVDEAVATAVDEATAKVTAEVTAATAAETSAKWRAWLARKEEAEARNQPFDEPPPG